MPPAPHPSDTIAMENSGTRGRSIWIPAGEARRFDRWLRYIQPESLVRASSGGGLDGRQYHL